MPNRKLPILAEHSLADVASARVDISTKFDKLVQQAAKEQGKVVTCRSGCSNCCYHPVHMTIAEGVLLYRYLSSKGRWSPSFRAKVTEHANQTRDLSYEVWLLSMLPCPLLDEVSKKCTAYSGRPFQCRVTYAVGDPYFCHPHRVTESEIVSKTEVTEEFHERVAQAIRRHNLTTIIMPLSVALLIAEKLVSGDFDLEGADLAILRDYLDNP